MTKGPVRFVVLPSAAEVAAAAAELIREAATRAIRDHGRFRLVLAGGRTPLAAYARLVGEPADWARWHCFFGDERCLPATDPGRNSVDAARVLLDRVPIPAANRHPIPAERGAAAAADDYQLAIEAQLPFDLVLLGMGEDGHTASLFPGHAVPEGPLVIPVYGAPKSPSERVSLTPLALTACRELLILVTGADKADALAAWRAGADLPVARVAALGAAQVLLDQDASPARLTDGRATPLRSCVSRTM